MAKYNDLNKQFINGAWADGCESVLIDNLNPVTDEIIHKMSSPGTKDIDAALMPLKAGLNSKNKSPKRSPPGI